MISSKNEEWFLERLTKKSGRKSDWEQLSRLSLIIPSYGRQDFLLRQIVYWSETSAQVIIVDGSPLPLPTRILEIFSSCENIRYLYSPKSVGERLNLAAQYIRTPYAVLLGDDEIFLKKGLCQAVAKLDNNPSLVACIGQSVTFRPFKDGGKITYGRGYPHWRYEIIQNDLRGRLVPAMAVYNAATCYAVLREPTWSRSWGAGRPDLSCLALRELEQALITYIHGKLSSVDEVYWLRSAENPSVKIDKVWEPDASMSFEDWWEASEFRVERESFVQCLVDEAVATGQVNAEEAKNAILEALDAYFKFCMNTQSARERSALTVRVHSMVRSLLHALLTNAHIYNIRSWIGAKPSGTYGSLSDMKSMRNAVPCLTDDDLFVELSEIEDLVMSFHRARQG